MPVILGLDLGEKRIGVAVSDEMEIIATPLKLVMFQGRKQLLDEILKLVEEYRASQIVVGLPKTLKGEIGISAQKIVTLVDWLKSQLPKIEWTLWDERLSTAEVERVLLDADVSRARRKEVRDKLAAQRILQNFLDFKRR